MDTRNTGSYLTPNLAPGEMCIRDSHNGLHVLGLMGAGAGAGVLVFVDGTLAPHALLAQIQDILGAVTEGHPVQQVINTGVAGMLQIVVDAQQLLGTGGGWIRCV